MHATKSIIRLAQAVLGVVAIASAWTCTNDCGNGQRDAGEECDSPDPPEHATCSKSCRLVCDVGFANCSDIFEDGCATNLRKDPLNCGACGHSCLGAPCDDGRCRPQFIVDLFEAASPISIFVDQRWSCRTQLDYAHFTANGFSIHCSDKALHVGGSHGYTTHPGRVAADDTNVYWTMPAEGRLLAAGSPTESSVWPPPWEIAVGQSWPGTVAVDAERVYWTDYTGGAIRAVDKAGSVCGAAIPCADIASGLAGPVSLVVDDVHVYWTSEDGTVARIAKAGGSVELVASGQTAPSRIVADEDAVYWLNRGPDGRDGSIVSAAKATLVLKELANGLANATVLAVDDQYVYWGELGFAPLTGAIKRVPKANGRPEVLAEGETAADGSPFRAFDQIEPGDIALDDAAIYWTEYWGQAVMMMAK